MPRNEFEDEVQIRNAINEFLNEHVMTTLEDVQDYVEEKTKFRPSATTISRIVNKMGYRKAWVKGVNVN